MKKSFTARATLAAGSAALASVPTAAGAEVITVTGQPVELALFGPLGETVGWDIDGNGSIEFELFRNGYDTSFVTTSPGYSPLFIAAAYRSVQMASVTAGNAPLNGRGLVAPPASITTDTDPGGEDDAQVLFSSFRVGPTLANNYTWGRTGERYRQIMYGAQASVSYLTLTGYSFTAAYATVGYDFFTYGFDPGANFFGFRFEGDAGLQYGWGVLRISLEPGNEFARITSWQYGTEAGEEVHVAEPSTLLPSLALLGLGAAGIRRWRKGKAESGEPASA